ncbi:MAG TPA: NADH-quinone oxidoreductase subunit C [Planctomycetota bacterium]|nr:NADH-quinone oxidoreductase subunit C [Planctomycetota bacterium]
MPLDFPKLLTTLADRFGPAVLGTSEFRGQHIVRIQRDSNVAVLKFLRDDPLAKFEMLTDVTCVDSLRLPSDMQQDYPERFAVVYQLTSLSHNARLRVKALVPEDPCEIDTVSTLWDCANWGEREVFDLFGIVFKGHPDLKRILMPDAYEGHPLRKDYPLKGRGERDNFPKWQPA